MLKRLFGNTENLLLFVVVGITMFLLSMTAAFATDVTVKWTDATYTDGTPITRALSYKLYHGNCGDTLSFNAATDTYTSTTAVRSNVQGKCLTYAVTTVVDGVESSPPTSVDWHAPVPPKIPASPANVTAVGN